jgi:hypothetical protein
MYSNGTYDASKASTCSGKAEQYVYENPCPKPVSLSQAVGSAPASASASSPTATGTNVDAERASGNAATPTAKQNNAAMVDISRGGPLVVGVAALMWHAM